MTIREKQILDYISTQISNWGYPPSIREICEDLKIKSTATVYKDIKNLEKEGYIKKGDPNKKRSLKILS